MNVKRRCLPKRVRFLESLLGLLHHPSEPLMDIHCFGAEERWQLSFPLRIFYVN